MAARKRRKKLTRAQEHRKLLDAHRHLYDLLLEYQGGGCWLCGRKPRPGQRRFALDHDHKAMAIRGILCYQCNTGLPNRVTPAWLRKAADYLENPPFERFKDDHGI